MIFERKLCIEKFEIENIYQTGGMGASNSRKKNLYHISGSRRYERNVYFPSFPSKKSQ